MKKYQMSSEKNRSTTEKIVKIKYPRFTDGAQVTDYSFPPITLMKGPAQKSVSGAKLGIMLTEDTLMSFGISAKVLQVVRTYNQMNYNLQELR